MKNIKLWLWKLKPRIHFLRDVIYINWFGFEWFIPRGEN
jgi:hypothetical protein